MGRHGGRRALLGLVLAGVLGHIGATVAQPSGGPGPTGLPPGHPGIGGSPTGYLDSLKTRLAITDAQQPAWQRYAEALTQERQQMAALHETMFAQMGTASEADQKAMIERMVQTREKAYASVRTAAEALLTVLTPAQQTMAQEILPGLARGPMPGGHPPVSPPRQ